MNQLKESSIMGVRAGQGYPCFVLNSPVKTIAQRQAALRQRRLDEGLTEVRGIYASPAHQAKIKAFAKALLKKPMKPK